MCIYSLKEFVCVSVHVRESLSLSLCVCVQTCPVMFHFSSLFVCPFKLQCNNYSSTHPFVESDPSMCACVCVCLKTLSYKEISTETFEQFDIV